MMKRIMVVAVLGVALAVGSVASGSLYTDKVDIVDLATANGGINPATGNAWQVGDQYRLVFISSTFVDPKTSAADGIAYWNSEVQAIANAATAWDLSGATWSIIGSTGGENGVDARDNTLTNPEVHGTGHAILHMDGSVLENNFADLWDGVAPVNMGGDKLFDENGVDLATSTAVNWPITGTTWNGTAHGTAFLKDTTVSGNMRQGHPTAEDGRGWVDAGNVGAAWFSDAASSVYGMSEALTVIPEPGTIGLLGLAGLGLLVRRRLRK